ncbi:P-loop NTPase [bacterium]|nr:P-loop NTPase [bacterium]
MNGHPHIAIASGKGGTGKTTVATSLARVLGHGVQLLDCDVEEPNARLFLRGDVQESRMVAVPVPVIDETRCDGCGECARFCAYNALAAVGGAPLVFPELCHGCGGCVKVCPRQAMRETQRRVGMVETAEADGVIVIQGALDVGVAMAPPVIHAVKAHARRDAPAVIDAPPGTSCPVIAAVRGADAVALVTEPTPFGLHDLRLAVEMTRTLAIPSAVIINRAGSGDDRVQAYCRVEGITVLFELPDERRIAEALARGAVLVDAFPEYRSRFERGWKQLVAIATEHHA